MPRLAALVVPLLTLAVVAALTPAGAAPDSEEAIILRTGERVACRIAHHGADPGDGFVHVEIGTRTYRIERANVRAVQAAGQPPLSPATLDLVRSLATHLIGAADSQAAADGQRQRAAQAALATFNTAEGQPYLEAVAATCQDVALATALRALVSNPDETTGVSK